MSKSFFSAFATTLGLAFSIGISCCATSEAAEEMPIANPNPTKIVRIFGTADSSLVVKISTVYASSEKKCRRQTNRIEGVSEPLSERVESDVSRSGTTYEARVAIDYFLEGTCRWYPTAIGFQVTNRDGLTTGSFGTAGKVTRHIDSSVAMIWIHTAGKGDSSLQSSSKGGAKSVVPLQRECRETRMGDIGGLLCTPPAKGNASEISEEATEVQVNFRDLTASASR